MTRTCSECGKPFELMTTKGRPRTKCYECRPYRPNQHNTGERRPVPPPKRQTVADVKANPHCPFCGAYPAAGADYFPFCNLRHRTMFAEKVQREADRQNMQQRKGRLGSDKDTMRGGISQRDKRGRIAA